MQHHLITRETFLLALVLQDDVKLFICRHLILSLQCLNFTSARHLRSNIVVFQQRENFPYRMYYKVTLLMISRKEQSITQLNVSNGWYY